MITRIPARVAATSILTLVLSACSSLPARGWRPEVEFRIEALYEFPAQSPAAVQVPASGDDLTIIELTSEPAGLRETFKNGKRYLLLPAGCRELHLQCRYRVYGYRENSPALPNPRQLFPGTKSLTIL